MPVMSKGKIGIFLPGANGDIALATCALKYKDILWPDKEIVWYCSLLPESVLGYTSRCDMLKFNDAISEIRHWPEGYNLPERCELETPGALAQGLPAWADFSSLKTEENRLHQENKYKFELTEDLDEGYFPAPWLTPHRPADMHYKDVSRWVFGADMSWEWRPYLGFSNEEREMVKEFRSTLPHDKTIMLETFMGSGDVRWSDNMTKNVMRLCRNKFGRCNFLFATNRDNSRFFDDVGVTDCSKFTVRQTVLLSNHCDLFVGVSSGISAAVGCWGNKPIPRLEWCGGPLISYASMSKGPFESVFYGNEPEKKEKELEEKLIKLLSVI